MSMVRSKISLIVRYEKMPIFLLLVLLAAQFSYAEDYQSLIITVDGPKSLVAERIKAAAKAVKNGKLIIAAANTEKKGVDEVIKDLPLDQQKRVMLVDSPGIEKWVVDTGAGWATGADGKRYFIGSQGVLNHGGAEISALLALCGAENISMPQTENEYGYGQGGNIVTDGAGTCAVSEDYPDNYIEVYKRDLKCKKVIQLPGSDAWPSSQNGHVDFAMSFAGPNTAIVAEVAESCTDKHSVTYRNSLTETVNRLERANVDVHRIPVGLDCARLEMSDFFFTKMDANYNNIPDDPPESVTEETLITPLKRGGQSLTFRSYANMVVLDNAYMVPEYKAPEGYFFDHSEESCGDYRCIVPTSQSLKDKLAATNQRAVDKLNELMRKGIIPKKEIIPYPISHDEVQSGGAARCMTLPIPDPLESCTQEMLDQNLETKITEASDAADCLASGKSHVCKLSKQIFDSLLVLQSPFGKFTNVRASADQEAVSFKEELIAKLKRELKRLKENILETCGPIVEDFFNSLKDDE